MSSKQIKLFIDRDLEELIPEFISSIRANIDKIPLLLESKDLEQLRNLGHNMKGSGGGYGFDKVSEIGQIIEHSAKVNDAQTILSSAESLRNYMDSITIEFVDVD